MKFQILNRWTHEVKIEVEISCAEDTPKSVQTGLAVVEACKSDADLFDADLSGADLRGADLIYADLSYADLSYADLRGANLSYANLSYANLSYANLSCANLSGADLSDADLSGTNLSYANLRYANLSDAILLLPEPSIGATPLVVTDEMVDKMRDQRLLDEFRNDGSHEDTILNRLRDEQAAYARGWADRSVVKQDMVDKTLDYWDFDYTDRRTNMRAALEAALGVLKETK